MSRLQTTRERLTLDEAMRFVGVKWNTEKPHVVFDPGVKPQYRIRRGSAHDGTMVFTAENVERALAPLLRRESYYKPLGEPPEGFGPVYRIGHIKLFSVYCDSLKLPCGMRPGQRERVVIPVRCEYVKR